MKEDFFAEVKRLLDRLGYTVIRKELIKELRVDTTISYYELAQLPPDFPIRKIKDDQMFDMIGRSLRDVIPVITCEDKHTHDERRSVQIGIILA